MTKQESAIREVLNGLDRETLHLFMLNAKLVKSVLEDMLLHPSERMKKECKQC